MKRVPSRFYMSVALLVAVSCRLCADEDPAARLARELAAEDQHDAAAIEYRRAALAESDAGRVAGYYWAAAYQYHRAGRRVLAARMLDRAEDASDSLTDESLLLRAEISLADREPERADFYLSSLIEKELDSPILRMASRRLARARLRLGDVKGARDVLAAGSHSRELAAVTRYEKGSHRIPALGGVLGIIPGLGYAYSGEYANALRSLILNALFIYAMVDTADDEEWGAFAAVTFFELTWYTGSIYGGIDAAQRYNRNRLQNCLDDIDGQSGFEPDPKQIPVISLRFDF